MKKTVIVKNAEMVKNQLEQNQTLLLNFKWGVSRGYETYGYNICSAYINGYKVGTCNGGGYDMQGTALAEFLNAVYHNEILLLDSDNFYGLYKGFCSGSCGLNEMVKIFEALGFNLEYHWNKKDGTMYFISKIKGELDK